MPIVKLLLNMQKECFEVVLEEREKAENGRIPFRVLSSNLDWDTAADIARDGCFQDYKLDYHPFVKLRSKAEREKDYAK